MMDLGSALRVLMRRWWILVIGLLLTLGGAYFVRTQTPYSYQSTASIILLLPPDARGAEEAGSPYIYLPNGLNVLARVAIAAPMSQSSRAAMAAEGLNSQFEMDVAPTSPEITISVEGSNPQNVIATRNRLIRNVESNLATVQEEVQAPPQQTAYAKVYDAEEIPQEVSGDRSRTLIAVIGVGGLITLLVTFALDRLLIIRKERRARRVAKPTPRRTDEDAVPGDGADSGNMPNDLDDDDMDQQNPGAGLADGDSRRSSPDPGS